MDTTARNRTIGGIVIGAILLVLLLILFSCTLASDPEKKGVKTDNPVPAPTATTTLSPEATPTEKPKKGKKAPGEPDSSDIAPAGYIPAGDTGVTFEPAGIVPSGFTPTCATDMSQCGNSKPPSGGVSACEADPSKCPKPPPTQPTTPPTSPCSTWPICQPGGGGGGGQTPAPACPSVTVSDEGTHSATVSWTAVSGADTYVVVLDNGLGARIFYPGDTLQTKIKHLRNFPVPVHSVRVDVEVDGQLSQNCSNSPIVLKVIGDNQPPNPPKGLDCNSTPGDPTSVDLDWWDNDEDDLDSYAVYKDGSVAKSGLDDSKATVGGLTPGTPATFTVTADDEDGNESGQSSSIRWPYDCDDEDPAAPTDVKVTHVTGTAADLTWTASTDDTWVDHYEIIATPVAGGAAVTAQTADASTGGSVTGLQKSTQYTFTVKAWDVVQKDSEAATAACGTTKCTTTDQDDTTKPSTPTDLVISDVTSTSFVATWTASTDDQTQASALVYNIDISGVSDNGSGVTTGKVTYTAGYQEQILLPRNATVTVTAVDQAGNKSDPATASTTVPPGSLTLNSSAKSPAGLVPSVPQILNGVKPSESATPSESASPSPSESPSESTTPDPSVVPSVPAILDPLKPSDSTSETPSPTPTPTKTTEPAAPKTTESTPSPTPSETSVAPKKTTDAPSEKAPVKAPSPSATTGDSSTLGQKVEKVLDGVAASL